MNDKMNDRLKFRVWDEESSEYLVWGYTPDYQLEIDLKSGKLVWQSVPDDEDEYPKELDTKHLVIEQCTGLKDKNGKLIYEGDILALSYQAGWQPILGVVKFDEKEACFLLSKNEKDKTPQSFWWNEGKEVIGNLHKNPELLEKEK